MTRTPNKYIVIVSNIGQVHHGENLEEARRAYKEYKRQSIAGTGRAAYEDVTLLKNGDVLHEHVPG